MRKYVFLAVIAVLSVPMLAQDRVEVFGGYQYLHNGNVTVNGATEPGTSQGYNGFDAAPAFFFTGHLGVQADFSGAYANISGVSTHIYTYSGGPVLKAQIGPVKPFVHVLFGGTRLTGSESGVSVSTNGYTIMFGGGVDAKLNPILSVRLAQVDWLYYHFSGFTVGGGTSPSFSGSNNVRISTGVVVHF